MLISHRQRFQHTNKPLYAAPDWYGVKDLVINGGTGELTDRWERGEPVDLMSPEKNEDMLQAYLRIDGDLRRARTWMEQYGFPARIFNINDVVDSARGLKWLTDFHSVLEGFEYGLLEQCLISRTAMELCSSDQLADTASIATWTPYDPGLLIAGKYEECQWITFANDSQSEKTCLFCARMKPFTAADQSIGQIIQLERIEPKTLFVPFPLSSNLKNWKKDPEPLLVAARKFLEEVLANLLHGIQPMLHFEDDKPDWRYTVFCPYQAMVLVLFERILHRHPGGVCESCKRPFFARRGARFCENRGCQKRIERANKSSKRKTTKKKTSSNRRGN